MTVFLSSAFEKKKNETDDVHVVRGQVSIENTHFVLRKHLK